jgi:CDP-paratose synthetase
MNILLTGATGFLGSHLLEALINEDHRVIILKRSTSNTWRINHLLDKVKFYDIDKISISNAFETNEIDLVIHTACNYGRGKQGICDIIDSNLIFGLKVLEAALKFKAKYFINTDTLLKKNLNNYSLSKKQFVEWLKHYYCKISVINFKMDHMYGPKDDINKFVVWLLDQFSGNANVVKLTHGEQRRDFIHVNDVVSAYLYIIDNIHNFNGFNEFDIGSGNPITLREFVEKLHSAYIDIHPHCSSKLGFGEIPYRENEQMSIDIDTSKLANHGWRARLDLNTMLDSLVKSY